MAPAARVLAFVAALAGAFLIAFLASRPPAGGSDISLDAAMAHIAQIAKAPHTAGSPAQAAVRAYLLDEMTKLGAAPVARPFPLAPDVQQRMAAWKTPAEEGVNLVGVLPGKDRALPPLLIMAHYDSVPGSPGAADDAAGVAVALEAARAMKGGNRRDLILLFTDAEEPGLSGAKAFFAAPPRLGAVMNLESRGGGGRVNLFETGEGSGEMMRLYAAKVSNPTANSFVQVIYKYLPNDTDFSPAKKLGLPGFNFAFIGDPSLYHSPTATPDQVDRGSVRHLGQQALDTLRAMDAATKLNVEGEYPVFSDVFGLFLITYPPALGWLPIALAAMGIALSASLAFRREDWRWRQYAVGLIAGVLLLVVTGAALYGMNLVSGPDSGYYDRLAATGWLEISAALLCLCIVLLLPRGWMGLWGGWIGLLTLGLILSIAVQVAAPQTGPLIAWPVMATALAAPVLAASNSQIWRLPALAVLALTAAFVLYWAHDLFVAAGQDFPSAMAPFAFLVTLALWPLLQPIPGRKQVAVIALVLLLASTGVAMKVWLDPLAPSAPTYKNK